MTWFGQPFSDRVPLTPGERVEVRRRAKQLAARRRGTWIVLAGAAVAIAILVVFVPSIARTLRDWGMPWTLALAATNITSVLVLLGVVFRLLHRIRVRAHREAVRELGFPVCVECGYYLRGHGAGGSGVASRCPECGRPR
jgi:uncharacterized membrane protein YozB (DUF420 family)